MVVAQALTLATRNMSFFIPQKPLTTHSYTQTHSLALNPKPYPLPLRTLIITSSRKNYNNNANDDNTNMFHHDKTSLRKNYSNNNPNDDNKNVFHHDKPSSSGTTSKSRRGNAREKTLKPDPVYHNRLVNMFVNRILKNEKKSLAYQIIYQGLKKIQQKTETNPLLLLRQAIRRVTPEVTVKARRRRGKSFQVPHEVGSVQGKALAIHWLLWAARKRSGPNMPFKLSSELMDAAKGSGDAFRKMEKIHKMAEASRAFAHIR